MRSRLPHPLLLPVAPLALLAALLLLTSRAGASDRAPAPAPLACPTGGVTWLEGTATPGRALIARFAGTPVGGGSADARGAWRIPLVVNAPAGIYPVAVVERGDGSLVATFTCFVDLPVGATLTSTPTPRPTEPPALAPSAHATATSPTTLAPTDAGDASAEGERAAPTPSLVETSSPVPSESGVTDPAPTAGTPTELPDDEAIVVLAAALADDPSELALREYVVVENWSPTPQLLAGWQLVHQATGERFVFPAVTLLADEPLLVCSGTGQDDLASGTLFWPAADSRWTPGDTAELHRPDGTLVSALLVPAAEGGDEAAAPLHRIEPDEPTAQEEYEWD